MPLVALSPTWGAFVAAYSIVRFALNGEWAVGSMLVAETWPARLRGLVLSFDRSAWGVGAALAGTIVTFVVTDLGVACGLRAARGGRAAGGLRPADVPGIALLGPHAGPQAAHRRARDAGLPLIRRRSAMDRQDASSPAGGSCSCPTCGATPSWRPSSPAWRWCPTARSACGCRCSWRSSTTGPPPSTAASTSGGRCSRRPASGPAAG